MNLPEHSRIMIVGCGGGYDIFCGLPLYFGRFDTPPILVNYTFTRDELIKLGECVAGNNDSTDVSSVYRIDADKITLPSKEQFNRQISGDRDVPDWLLAQLGVQREEYCDSQINGTSCNGRFYFPEYELSKAIQGPVYAFHGDRGGAGILKGLQNLVEMYNINTILTVDGGTDSLMLGHEEELGTPHEDMLTLSVINRLVLDNQSLNLKAYLYVLGYNIDAIHNIQDRDVLSSVMDMIRKEGFLGCYHLLNNPESSRRYYETFLECSPENSWINSLVCASLVGREETPSWIKPFRGETKIPVSPLMGLYWIFDLPKLVGSKYWDMERLAETRNDEEVCLLINNPSK